MQTSGASKNRVAFICLSDLPFFLNNAGNFPHGQIFWATLVLLCIPYHFVTNLCDKLLWQMFVMNFCDEFLWRIFVTNSYDKFVWQILVMNSCDKFMRRIHGTNSCDKNLDFWQIFVTNFSDKLFWQIYWREFWYLGRIFLTYNFFLK